MSLFSDIRQLLMYLREVHGSTFRRNMLVAMMCPIQRACERPQPKLPPNWSRMSTRNSMWLLPRADKRRSSSLFSDGIGDYDLSGPGAGAAPLTKGQRFTSWQALLPRSSVMGRGIRLNSTAGQLFSSDKSTDPLRARGEPELNTTQLVIEHRWVNTPALKEGLRDFAFLMECCEPGTIPEPQLVAALLDLDAPVVARACLLLECANLVHRCNRGEWASWMKFNLPSTYQPGTASAAHVGQRLSPNAGGVNGSGGIPDMMVVKRNAGNLFHAWGEALGSRVRHFVHVMNSNMNQSASNASIVTFTGVAGSGGAVGGGSSHGGAGGSCTGNGATAMAAATPTPTTTSTSDKHRDSIGRLFSVLENEENFLDDASVNPTGESCPYALLAVGVQLLLEITTYLREMHPRLPQASTTEDKHKPSSDQGPDGSTPGTGSISGPSGTKLGSGTDRGLGKLAGSSGPRASFRAARRRLSILMPIFGSGGSVNVEESTAELEDASSAIAEQIAPGRRAIGSRRISFAVFSDNKEGRNSLLGSASSLDRSPDSVKHDFKATVCLDESSDEVRSNQIKDPLNKSLLSKSLLRHRGSGSFKRESPTKQENLGVYGRYGGRFGMRARSNSGEAYTKLLPDAEDPSVSQDTEEDAKQSDTESQRANAKSSKSSKSTAELRPNRAKSQNASSRIRATEDQMRTHTVVRRSVSAALTTRRHRTSSIFSQTNANAGDSINGDQIVCSTNMPWIDPVIEFLNHTNFSCDHQNYCAPNCFERQQHQCRALLNAVNQIYGSDVENSFVKSIERQMGASSGENAARPGAEDSVTRSRSEPPTVKSFDLTDESSDSDPSSRAGSTEDISAGSDGNSYSHNPASGGHLVSKLTTGKYAGARGEFHAVRSHDGLSRLNKSGGGDSDVDLQALLSQRTDSIIPIEIHKPRSTLFSKSSRRKESQFSNLSGRRDSTSLLEKFRLRSSNRGSTNGPTEPDGLGLTSLLGLSVLAGAGAGLLQSASSPGSGGVGLWAMGETSEFEGNGDPCERMNPTRNNFRATNNPELPIQRYLVNQVKNLRSSPFDLLNKSALLLTTQQMTKVLPLAWELLLEPEEDLISSAACFILFCGVRSPATVQDILLAEMQHELPSQRLNAILRFRALWTHRYHVWSRLDEGAPNQLRLPPSIIEFVLPSPTLGYPGYEAPDPVWQIRKGTSAEEVQLKQNEATKTFVTASTSRRKQQQELLVRALAAEAIRRRDARRHFHLTTCPVLERAAIEPAFSKEHRDEGTDDGPNSATGVGPGTVGGAISSNSGAASSSSGGGVGGVGGVCSGSVGVSAGGGGGSGGGSGASSSMQEEFAAAVRRLSVAPINRNLWNQTRNSSWRQGSIPWFRTCAVNHDDEDRGGTHSLFPSQPLQQAQSIFPSALCAATVPLIHLLDDTSVNEQGMAANLPCAKQFNVFDNDIGVAQLVRLQDENKDYQFDDILKDVLEANGIPIGESHSYFLFDERSNIIRNSSHYVRDFYPFKRNHTPKMRLKQLNKEQGLYLLQRNALNLKFQEIGKVLFTNAVLNCTPSSQVILQAILPFILRDLPAICAEENCGTEPKKAEIVAVQKISTTMRQLISTTEFMTRRVEDVRQLNIHAPGGPIERRAEPFRSNLTPSWSQPTSARLISVRSQKDTESPGSRDTWDTAKRGRVGGLLTRVDSLVGESRTGVNVASVTDQPMEPLAASRWNYEPREIILQLACDFLSCCSARLAEMGERQRIPELLDPKSHVRLSELAQSFIKQVPTNPDLLSGTALQRYFLEILPLVEWGHESMRSCKALESLLNRINRTLPKLLENFALRVLIETLKKAVIFDPSGCLPALVRPKPEVHTSHSAWSGISNAVPGRPSLGETLFNTITPETSTTNASVPGRGAGKGRSPNNGEIAAHGGSNPTTNVLMNRHGMMDSPDAIDHGVATRSFKFAAEVVRLIALVLQVMGTPPSQQQQQQQCQKQTSSQQKTQQQQQQQKMLQSNPQSLKHGGKHEVSSGTGLVYATNFRTRTSVISTGVKPSLTLSKSKTPSTNTRLLDPSTVNALSVGERPTKFKAEFAHRLGFLGLKLILVAYSRHASVRLRLLTATLTKLALNGRSGIQLWKFFDFLTTHRPPLFVHLLPFIRFKLGRLQCATPGEQAYQQIVSQKLIGLHLPVPQTTAAVLRELMLELGTIQHDVQVHVFIPSMSTLMIKLHHILHLIKHFTQTQFQELQPTRSTHESVRRLYSTDHSPAVQKRSSRKVKTKLSGLAEESSRQESEVSLLDHANLSNRVDVLASVTSESACSSEQLFDDNGFGLPTSAESILRQSQNVSHRKTRKTSITKSESAQPVPSRSHLAKANFLLSDATFDEQSLGSFTSDELRGPVGPAAAAAIATSLYGSGAPYIHARDKARQELALLVGILPPEVETSTDRRDSSNLDLSLSDQSLINTAASKLDTVARGGTGLAVKSGRPESRTQKAKTPQRASKIDYV
ncbi:hypothetical protein FGIG_03319 [Fasciola gigantica]|uniref:Protein unc-80 n=1 Tax=Fasciola gigantica TaxID=46835 RepID=A0A504YR61_FASGI|nr:hypothetical protein FGIG_03319 [Fasciola gigantica]